MIQTDTSKMQTIVKHIELHDAYTLCFNILLTESRDINLRSELMKLILSIFIFLLSFLIKLKAVKKPTNNIKINILNKFFFILT